MTSPGAISSHYSGPSRTERIFFVEQQAAEYHAQLALLKLDSHADCLLVNFPSENNNNPLTGLSLQPGQQCGDVRTGLPDVVFSV